MHIYDDFSENGKKYLRGAFALFLMGLILASFAIAAEYAISAKKAMKSPDNSLQMSFSGEGKVSAKPDIVTLNASVVTERKTVSEAQAENTMAFNKIAEFLENAGIAEKDFKTVNYSIQPQYFYPENRRPEITGYQVRNSMGIKIRDLSKIDDVLGGITENGANEVGNVSFTIENPEKLKNDARKLAIAEAKEKAKTLAKNLGVRLGRISGFSENEGGFPSPVIYRAEAMSIGKSAGDSAGPDLSGGEQEIRVNVSVTYDFVSW